MNLKPLDDRIVVKPNEAEKTTASGLVIPTPPRRSRSRAPSSPSAPAAGATTPASTRRSTSRSATPVLYSKYGGTEVTIDGDDLLILTSRDVLAIVGS
jgi:chaperonin GroES